MSDAKKCDRSKRFYDPYEVNRAPVDKLRTSFINNRGESEFNAFDLCPKCADNFLKWVIGYEAIEPDNQA